MLAGGYLGKLLRVNLTTKECGTEDVSEELFTKLLGGRGVAAKYYHDEIGADVDPLDEANKVIFFAGPLTGVALPSTTKFQLSTKSPETGHYLCSNCGGTFGPELKKCGLDGLIIEGKSAEWTYLTIADGEVTFGDAGPMLGMSSNETLAALRTAMGDEKAAALSIGPAGERLVRISYVNVDTRAFGRGGPGAVLGSKQLKGIAIRGTGETPVADPARVKEIRSVALAQLKETRANHTKFGTAQYIEVMNDLGCMPTRNFQTTSFEGGAGVDAHRMRDHFFKKNYACYRCPVACGKMCEVTDGPFKGAKARAEYETIGLLGPSCGIDDFAAVIAGNEACDELGLDTISAGNAVALTMELFERGLITTEDTCGIEARFGSGQALVDLVKLIAERRGIGDLLAEGMKEVARQRPEWKPYIIDVKGMPFAAYDPRGFYGHALTCGTSSRGACHNVGGWTIRHEVLSGDYDRFATKGKGLLVKSVQDSRAFVDSLGICTVVRSSMGFSEAPSGDTLEAVTGHPFTPKLIEIAERIYSLERVILNREGITRADDMMPERIMKEAVPSGPIKGRRLTEEQYAEMLDEYYDARGWDADGVVTEETRSALGIAELVS